jgi:23S rRNA (guanosine2251-2'-O)-methyltransferase
MPYNRNKTRTNNNSSSTRGDKKPFNKKDSRGQHSKPQEGRRNEVRGDNQAGRYSRKSSSSNRQNETYRRDDKRDTNHDTSGNEKSFNKTSRTTSDTYWIVGKNPVLTTLKTNPKRVQKVLLVKTNHSDNRIDEIYSILKSEGIPFQQVSKMQVEQKLANAGDEELMVHQGVAAHLSPRPLLNLYQLQNKLKKEITAGKKPLVIALDKVTDPRNYGAILRVADAAGASAVVVTKRNHVGFSAVVAKTACGAESTVDVAVVPNLVQTIESLQEDGFWVYGADAAPNASMYTQEKFSAPSVLVMGSEGDGLSRLTAKACDHLLKIPMFGTVESLNVSTATAVLAIAMAQSLHQPAQSNFTEEETPVLHDVASVVVVEGYQLPVYCVLEV